MGTSAAGRGTLADVYPLAALGVRDVVQFELFDGGHGGIDWRYPLAIRFLAERLARS